jgi:hypothetical protein
MDKINTSLQASPNSRLRQNPFYLKFCPARQSEITDNQLILTKGITVPVEYYTWRNQNGYLLGPRGGKVVTYQNMGRWINNDLFINLINRGWIGTEESVTSYLFNIAAAALDQNRMVIETHY